jgi:hypothetical protein
MVHGLDGDRDKVGIELSAGCDLQNSERDPDSDGRFYVWYFDRVEGVGNRENPGSKGDESSPDAIGIARSVPSLVVVGYEDGSLTEKEERFEKQGAKPRMVLNGDVGLQLKTVADRHKVGRKFQEPDVVEEGGEIQIVQLD